MTVWIIEPRDPLIARDGRPFDPTPGVRAVSLAFPFPSTTTGALRSQAGMDEHGVFDRTQIERVKGIPVRGPLLVELDGDDRIIDWLLPAPADALLFDADKELPSLCRRLTPLKLPDGAATDLPNDLALVGMPACDRRKPKKDAPAFWRQMQFEKWLCGEAVDPNDIGHTGPTRESRIHIKRDPNRFTAEDGKLFETEGLEFTRGGEGKKAISNARRLALAVITHAELPNLRTVDTLGGERRLAMWRGCGQELPECPPEMRERIVAEGHCRVILLTPAHFKEGFRPGWLEQPRLGVTPKLIAAAVGRPQVVSGWDYDLKGRKPTRRLAPAGGVFFLKLEGGPEAIKKWVADTWMQCVSDDEQDRRDGFGLAVLGTWDGVPLEIKPQEASDDAQAT